MLILHYGPEQYYNWGGRVAKVRYPVWPGIVVKGIPERKLTGVSAGES